MRKVSGYGVLVVVVVAAALAGLDLYVRSLSPRAKARVTKAIGERFDADVTLGGLQLSLFTPSATGGSLVVRHRGWNDRHPLIYISHFSAESTFFNLFFQRDKVRLLTIEGLQIHVPHRGQSASKTTRQEGEEIETNQPGKDRTQLKIGIATIVADGTQLEIEPKDPGKEPLRFDIRKLKLHSVGPGQPMRFESVLHNPKPPGLITTHGHFGPWQKEDPRATAVSGEYEFRNADLSVFKGISGILSSTGAFDGVLQHIQVRGQTDTPDFALRKRGSPVHLQTTFRSIVNGMNGDTILDNIDARFLHSEFICKGDVSKKSGRDGKTVNLLAVTKQNARMEDILTLVMADKAPFMTGAVQFQSKILIPPGPEAVIDKLRLDGDFKLTSAVFTSPKVNGKIATLSDRARGITKDEEDKIPQQTIASGLSSKFSMEGGTLALRSLLFCVPGASVKLNGTLNLPSRRLDLKGLFLMRATLSDTQSGLKHWLLKPIDPLFEKDGAGLELPFDVTGTQDHPTLSVSAFHHTFRVK
jgi:hypothetical protein